MIESDIRRRAQESHTNREDWRTGLEEAGESHDIYAGRRAFASRDAGHDFAREAGVTGRAAYDQHDAGSADAINAHDSAYEEVVDDQGDSYWTYDEELGAWVDPDGNPYVEPASNEDEDRYSSRDQVYEEEETGRASTYTADEEAYYEPRAGNDTIAPQADPYRAQPRSGLGMGSVAAGVLVLCLLGGTGYAWKKGAFVGSVLPGIGSAPPVIKASTDPIKIKPAETAPADQAPVQEIFNPGGQPTAPAKEVLVPREEQPVANVPVRTEAEIPAPAGSAPNAAQADDGSRQVATSTVTLPPPLTSSDAPPAETPPGTRTVKTIKIPENGDAVTGEAVLSGGNASQTSGASPVDIPLPTGGAPATQAGTPTVPTEQAAIPTQPEANPADAEPAAAAPATGSDEGESKPEGATVATAEPPVRPRNIPQAQEKPVQTQLASAEPTPAASPVPGASGYFVQVSSQRSQAEAQAAFASLQRKYGSIFGSRKASIRKAELGDRGTYYRVRVGPWSKSAEAEAFCTQLKSAGGDCVIVRN